MLRTMRPTAIPRRWISRSAAPLLFLTCALQAGCAGIGLPIADFHPERTGATVAAKSGPTDGAAAAIAAIDPSDWEAVRRAVAEAITARNTTVAINWSNPDTGSSGTIAPLLTVAAGNSACRPFATTLSDARGVRRFRGDACRESTGRIQLLRVVADDPALI